MSVDCVKSMNTYTVLVLSLSELSTSVMQGLFGASLS